MRYLKNRSFQRGLKEYELDDEYVKEVLWDIARGRAQALGNKMYKIRAAREGQGKSGGYRNIFFWKRDEFIVFCYLFAKNEQDNLDHDEQKTLKMWSNTYEILKQEEIRFLIENNTFTEVVL